MLWACSLNMKSVKIPFTVCFQYQRPYAAYHSGDAGELNKVGTQNPKPMTLHHANPAASKVEHYPWTLDPVGMNDEHLRGQIKAPSPKP